VTKDPCFNGSTSSGSGICCNIFLKDPAQVKLKIRILKSKNNLLCIAYKWVPLEIFETQNII